MKAVTLLAVISLALSVSAAGQSQQNNNNLFGGNRGRFGNNNGFFGGGRNGQNNNNRFGGNNNNNNNNKNLGNTGKNNGGAAASSAASSAAAASSATAAAGSASGSSAAAAAAASASAAAAASAASAAAANTATAAAAASTSAAANTGDPQTSTTLDPRVIATGFANNGQDVPAAGQVASLTSTNNFINFCLTVPNLPITNGKQITTGSCNPAPMGVIPSSDNMPSAKFQVPKNGDTLTENTPFTITMAIANFESGNFVNAQANYFAAPQQINGGGQIVGHSHVVVEQLSALDQTTPTDPRKFAFFKGLNAAAVNGVLTADVTAGLPAGFYRLASINTAANHQPVLVPIAQHGSLDDAVYFTVTAGAASAAQASAAAAGVATATAAASAAPAASSAAAAGVATATAAGSAASAASSAASKLSAVSAPGAKVVPPAKIANPKRIKRSFSREY